MSNNSDAYFNTLLYFYSTAPQVLGAILAISGAFVVFKLDSLKKELFGTSQKLLDYLKKFGEIPTDLIGIGRDTLLINSEINYERLKYAQIQRDINLIEEKVKNRLTLIQTEKDLFKQLRLVHTTMSLKRKTRLDIQATAANSIILKKQDIEKFIMYSRITYIVNGFIIALLLSFFFFLPRVSQCTDCFLTFNKILSLGLSITTFSLLWIVVYLSFSISLSLKLRKKKEIKTPSAN